MADNVTYVFGSWLPALAAQQGQQGTTGAKQPRENSSADGLPSKRAKPTRRGGRGRGQGLPQEQIGNVVTMLASLCLQQEDALNRIRLETSHTLHLAQQGQGAVLQALYNAGTAWQVRKNSGGGRNGCRDGQWLGRSGKRQASRTASPTAAADDFATAGDRNGGVHGQCGTAGHTATAAKMPRWSWRQRKKRARTCPNQEKLAGALHLAAGLCLSEHHRPAVTAGGQWILPALAVSDEPDFVSVRMATWSYVQGWTR